jgi:hypothetical protein
VTAASAAPSDASPTEEAPGSAPAQPVVREEQKVLVDGREERWSLVWASPPALSCFDEGWHTCLCYGHQLGETGQLSLVRKRADGSEQRLDFGKMSLPRWPTDPDDLKRFGDGKVDIEAVRGRPLVKLMKIGDYDHDGRATEFVLERGGDTCGFHDAVLVGVTRTRDEPHVVATAYTPPFELDLPHASDWEKVERRLPTEIVYIPCGFNGGWPTFEVVHVSRDARGLHARHRRYDCLWVRGSAVRGKLLLERPWTARAPNDP